MNYVDDRVEALEPVSTDCQPSLRKSATSFPPQEVRRLDTQLSYDVMNACKHVRTWLCTEDKREVMKPQGRKERKRST